MFLEEKARKEEELQKRKIAIQRKQAIFNKILAVAEIGINLQQEISKNNATLGTLLAQPVNALAIASAAIRTATVLATPLPQYEKGTEFHKGGKALVGEKRTEVVENPDGSIFLTPNKPTIMDLKMGAKVYPSVDEFKEKKLAIQNASIMASFGSQSRQLQMFDYYLGRELHGISNKIEKGIEKGFKKAKIYNNVRVPKIDIGHIHYKNSGLT